METAAEVLRLEHDGANLVGMTGMPEAVLAREAGLPYAALTLVGYAAAGKGECAQGIVMDNIQHALQTSMPRVRKILATFVALEKE